MKFPKKKMVRRIADVVNPIFSKISTVSIFILMVVLATLGLLKVSGIQVYEVASNSMVPVFYKGDIVFGSKEHQALAEGDIALYRAKWTPKVVVHRIHKVLDNGEYIFKGDANDIEDPLPVKEYDVIGEVVGFSHGFAYLYNKGTIYLLVFGVILPLTAETILTHYGREKNNDKRKRVTESPYERRLRPKSSRKARV